MDKHAQGPTADYASMTGERWVRVVDEAPPEGAVVETLSEGGIQTELKRRGSLWFVPDGSMYVYYTPIFWRATS